MRYVNWFIEHLVTLVTIVLVLQGLVVVYGFWDVIPDVKKILAGARSNRKARNHRQKPEESAREFEDLVSSTTNKEHMEQLIKEMTLKKEITMKLQDLMSRFDSTQLGVEELEEVDRYLDSLRSRAAAAYEKG